MSPASSRTTSSASIPAGRIPYAAPGRHQGVPDLDRALGRDPQLVAEVAGVAGPRHVDGDLADLRRPAPEVAKVVERLAGRGLEDVARERALEGERRRRLGLLGDRHVEAGAVLAQPAELRVGRGPAVEPLVESMDRAVVDDLAVLVAPRACR